MTRYAAVIACGLLALAAGVGAPGAPGVALAGTGKMFPTYHPPKAQTSCTDGECKGDDPRSGLPCQGLLCGLASAKSLQPPVTAVQAEEAARARAATAVAPVPPSVVPARQSAEPKRNGKRVAGAKTVSEKRAALPVAAPAAEEAAR